MLLNGIHNNPIPPCLILSWWMSLSLSLLCLRQFAAFSIPSINHSSLSQINTIFLFDFEKIFVRSIICGVLLEIGNRNYEWSMDGLWGEESILERVNASISCSFHSLWIRHQKMPWDGIGMDLRKMPGIWINIIIWQWILLISFSLNKS
jgi:hypothetical protein